ncbi:hypothetical protein RSAG8_10722, partial [Rhizoctonia solani AG-8 WAC10335]
MSEHEELKATGSLLSSALDKYLDTSLAFRNSYVERNSSAITPPGLPSRAESGLQFLAALELKLQMVKMVANQTRNYSTSLIPIHKLPQELLARVFLSVFGSRPTQTFELRLIRGALRPDNAVISEDDLIGIIRASPALRILQFSLTIVQALSAEPLVSPISLEHLELLNVAGMAPNELGALLRWVAPGPKPLRLAINLDSDCSSDIAWLRLPDNEVTSFFARSHVSKIYPEHGDYKIMFHLLDLCPCLTTLACSSTKTSEPQSHLPEQDELFISHPALESLLILKGSVNTTPMLNIISGSPALQRILFWKCYYYDGQSSKSLCVDNLEVMVGLGPVVQIIDYDPTRDWEISAP